jgi:heme A synthase
VTTALLRRLPFDRLALGVLVYTLAVIAWGAFVRASGSGAGCADHWPLCNGEIVPRAPTTAMAIEFTHRVTSGLLLFLVATLVLAAFGRFARAHPVRRAALAAAVFTGFEAAIGAVLVLLQKVGQDASVGRAFLMGFHLANTFFLLAALACAWWWARGGALPPLPRAPRLRAAFVLGLAGTLGVGAAGAVTALGDTLFPTASLAAGMAQDLSPTAHFLLRLRVIHPVLALLVAAYWIALASRFASRPEPLPGRPAARDLARAVLVLVCAQLAAGVLNLLLLAPAVLQLLHLVLADVLWIAGLLFALEALAAEAPVQAACYNGARCVPIRSSPR